MNMVFGFFPGKKNVIVQVSDLSVVHTVTECGDFAVVRQRYYNVENFRINPGNQCYRSI